MARKNDSEQHKDPEISTERQQEIVEKLKRGEIQSITFDTNAVKTNGNDLNSGVVAELSQLKGGLVKLILSDVILGEIRKHMREAHKTRLDRLAGTAHLLQRYFPTTGQQRTSQKK